MLSTPCSLCEFARMKPTPGCEAGQCCRGNGENSSAPGFCRLFGRVKSGTAQEPVEDRIKRARERSALKFDLVILFDERRHTSQNLQKSMSRDYPCCQKLIVIDTTGNELRTGVARHVLSEEDIGLPYSLECLVESEESHLVAMDWAQRLIQAPYFLVLEAGRFVDDLHEWANHIRFEDSRVIHWHFPVDRGETVLVQPTGINGAWITAAYRQLGGNMTKSIFEKMAIHEAQSDCGLSWLIEGATLG